MKKLLLITIFLLQSSLHANEIGERKGFDIITPLLIATTTSVGCIVGTALGPAGTLSGCVAGATFGSSLGLGANYARLNNKSRSEKKIVEKTKKAPQKGLQKRNPSRRVLKR